MRLVLVALAALLLSAAPAHAQSFAQLPGEGGCILQTGIDLDDFEEDGDAPTGCGRAGGLISADGVVLSPDGKHAYVVAGGGAVSGSNGVALFGRDGTNGALAAGACVTATGGDGRVGSDGLCARANALRGAAALAFSPDGRFAYVAATGSNAISWFERDAATGALTQRGCVKHVFGIGEACSGGYALDGASGVAVSPDGKHVYVAASRSNAVAVFTRDETTGALTEVGCVSDTGSDGACTDGTALAGAGEVLIAADGADVYVISALSASVTAFRREATTGKLTGNGCLLADAPAGGPCTSVKSLEGAAGGAITADGRALYVAGEVEGTLTALTRDPGTGKLSAAGCWQAREPREDEVVDPDDYYGEEEGEAIPGCERVLGLGSVTDVAVAADGRSVFAAGDYSLAAFTRDPSSGALAALGCVQSYAYLKACSVARGLGSSSGIAASSDGRNLYVTNASTNSVTVFAASVAIASSSARVSRAGTIRVRLTCPQGRVCTGDVRVAGARAARYRLASGKARAVTVRVARGAARRHVGVVVARDGRAEVRRRVTLR
ncbi:beta-propeller fold lactonase family protein [Solirubrobacter taibaiensis]|nr:beta-propeller fold lactonase family protein [Solirubrobacter taibaiensis]